MSSESEPSLTIPSERRTFAENLDISVVPNGMQYPETLLTLSETNTALNPDQMPIAILGHKVNHYQNYGKLQSPEALAIEQKDRMVLTDANGRCIVEIDNDSLLLVPQKGTPLRAVESANGPKLLLRDARATPTNYESTAQTLSRELAKIKKRLLAMILYGQHSEEQLLDFVEDMRTKPDIPPRSRGKLPRDLRAVRGRVPTDRVPLRVYGLQDREWMSSVDPSVNASFFTSTSMGDLRALHRLLVAQVTGVCVISNDSGARMYDVIARTCRRYPHLAAKVLASTSVIWNGKGQSVQERDAIEE